MNTECLHSYRVPEDNHNQLNAQRPGEAKPSERRDCSHRRRSLSISFGVRRMRRSFVCGAVTTPMAMGVGIQKMSERRPTNEVVCPSTNSTSASCRRASASCRRNAPFLECHLSCESVRSNLSAARFVGECLSDTNGFTSVDTCVGAYTHPRMYPHY